MDTSPEVEISATLLRVLAVRILSHGELAALEFIDVLELCLDDIESGCLVDDDQTYTMVHDKRGSLMRVDESVQGGISIDHELLDILKGLKCEAIGSDDLAVVRSICADWKDMILDREKLVGHLSLVHDADIEDVREQLEALWGFHARLHLG